MLYDAHIHLERYSQEALTQLFSDLRIDGMIAVSTHLASCRRTQALARQFPGVVYPAYGFHPEQPFPGPWQQEALFDFIQQHQQEMVAVGEVGLPYYTRQQYAEQGRILDRQPYIELLEQFILLAKTLRKPVVLHAVHEDAVIACDLLERHAWHKAHFHWYKGPAQTTQRMMQQGYFVSVTPDIFYKPATQQLVQQYPLECLMVETDGPWPFRGPFSGQMTHPNMVVSVVEKIASIKQLAITQVAAQLSSNTRRFYHLWPKDHPYL